MSWSWWVELLVEATLLWLARSKLEGSGLAEPSVESTWLLPEEWNLRCYWQTEWRPYRRKVHAAGRKSRWRCQYPPRLRLPARNWRVGSSRGYSPVCLQIAVPQLDLPDCAQGRRAGPSTDCSGT